MTDPEDSGEFDSLLTRIESDGVLLLTDPRLPSLTSLVAGEPVRGSWWAHPEGERMFTLSNQLSEHPEVQLLKLLQGKLSFVHRRCWPALYAVGNADEPWQIEGLAEPSRELLAGVRAAGQLEASGKSVPPLEQRLLAVVESVHTDSGAHAKRLRSWPYWATERGFRPGRMQAAEGRLRLEELVSEIAEHAGCPAKLPWNG